MQPRAAMSNACARHFQEAGVSDRGDGSPPNSRLLDAFDGAPTCPARHDPRPTGLNIGLPLAVADADVARGRIKQWLFGQLQLAFAHHLDCAIGGQVLRHFTLRCSLLQFRILARRHHLRRCHWPDVPGQYTSRCGLSVFRSACTTIPETSQGYGIGSALSRLGDRCSA